MGKVVAVIRKFYCEKCGDFNKVVAPDARSVACETCHQEAFTQAPVRYGQAPALIGDIRNHFNPHYDLQLGQHFESAEQKSAFLQKHGRTQYSGQSSPRRDTGTSFRCTKKQAAKEFGIVENPPPPPRCTNEEI